MIDGEETSGMNLILPDSLKNFVWIESVKRDKNMSQTIREILADYKDRQDRIGRCNDTAKKVYWKC